MSRHAILGDLDTPDNRPCALVSELDDGSAYVMWAWDLENAHRYKRNYRSFEDALQSLHRSYLVRALLVTEAA